MNAALVFFALPLFNDGSGALGVGGTVMPLGGNRFVRMVSEHVSVTLPTGEVRTRFLFENTGPASSVVMIFPENGSVGDGAIKHAENSYFKYFRSWVDGKRIKVSRLLQKKTLEDGLSYEYWWTKRVPFKNGQKRVVVNKYRGGIGWGGTGEPESDTFEYILKTGVSWKGNIDSATIEADVTRIKKKSSAKASPDGFIRRGNKLVWTFKNFKPKGGYRNLLDSMMPSHSLKFFARFTNSIAMLFTKSESRLSDRNSLASACPRRTIVSCCSPVTTMAILSTKAIVCHI